MIAATRDGRFEIRPITPDDFTAVLSVYQACEDFLAMGPEPTASMKMVIDDVDLSRREGGVFCGIYRTETQVIGVVDYVPARADGNSELAFLSLLLIAPPFRQLGIGNAVVEAIESEIRTNLQIKAILSLFKDPE